MAKNLHQLAIEIQGDIDSRFGGAINEMTGQIKQLESDVKSIADSKMKPDALTGDFIKLSHDAGETAKEIETLNRRMKQIDGYNAQKQAAVEAGKAYMTARREVRRLEESQKKSGSKEMAAALKRARSEAANAEKAYKKQRGALNEMDKSLKDAGIDTQKLGDEQKRLAGELEAASKKSEQLGQSLSKIKQAKYGVEKLKGQFKQLGSDIKTVGKIYLAMGATIAGVGVGFYKITDSVAAAGDEAAKSAAKLHMTTEGFQAMQYAAKLSGVKDFTGMITKYNAAVAKAGKDKNSAKALSELGISAKQLQKMGPEKSILVISDELNKIKDPAKRARVELALFGKNGAEMGAFLKQGSEGIKNLMGEAKDIGLVISDETTKQAEAFNDAREEMGGALTGLKNIIGAELLPTFTDLFGQLTDFITGNGPMIRDFAQNLGEKFKEAVPMIMDFARGIGKIISKVWDGAKKLSDFVGGADRLAMIFAALPLAKPLLTFGEIIKTLWNLKSVIGLVGKAFLANPILLVIAAIAAGAIWIYKNWDWLKEKFGEIAEKFASWFLDMKNRVENAFSQLPDGVKNILGPIISAITRPFRIAFTVIDGIIGYFRGDFESFPDALKSILSGVLDIIAEPFRDAEKLISSVVESIKKFFTDIPDDIMKALAGLKDIIMAPFKEAFEFVTSKLDSIVKAFNAVKDFLGFGDGGASPIPPGAVGAGFETVKDLPGRARGGLITHPTISTFAERGPEVAVPVGMADRGLGLANLDIASRALGLGGMRGGKPIIIESNPVLQISVNGGDPEEFRRVAIEVLRDYGAKMIPEWAAQIERTSYATG